MVKETIRAAIGDAMDENPNDMADKINDAINAKVADVLKTKKMEVSNDWLNDIKPSPEEEEED